MNVIFDLGRVVLEWDYEAILASMFDDAPTREKVRDEVFLHEDWITLDRGEMEQSAAIARFAGRTGVDAARMRVLMDKVPESLRPMEETLSLVRGLKKLGHDRFCLSNMHKASYEYLVANHAFWNLFNGVVISAYVGMVKPDRAIYEHVLDKFGLDANETLLVDDAQANLDGAAQLGIRGILFADAEDCAKHLSERFGIDVPPPLESLRGSPEEGAADGIGGDDSPAAGPHAATK